MNFSMSPLENRATCALSGIYAVRMLGLFIIVPILTLYTHQLQHASPFLIGLALGIYGLTQLLLQLPLSMLSDRWGRKPVILIGLLLFLLGSIVAALTHNIYCIILGRALQGTGAIGSTLIALLADVTTEENRLKAMSVIGMTIGFSFIVAMIIGPVLNHAIGLSGIFAVTAGLTLVCIGLLKWAVPVPTAHTMNRETSPVASQLKRILTSSELLKLDLSIFFLHAILMVLFLALPTILIQDIHWPAARHWELYLPVLLIAFILMFPFVILAETKRQMKPVLLGAVAVLFATSLSLWFWHQSFSALAIALCLFFAAFTLLESILPSLITKLAPAGSKGTAMGIYSTWQFFGIFLGGLLGGLMTRYCPLPMLFLFCALLAFLWFLVALTLKRPPHWSSKRFALSEGQLSLSDAQLLLQLRNTPGVKEVVLCREEQCAYLKIDKKEYLSAEPPH